VTSDRRIVQAAEKARVAVLSSPEFLRRLQEDVPNAPPPEAKVKTEGISPAEAQWWLKEFGLEAGEEGEGRRE